MAETEAEIQESDEINSRVMDPLRLINEATKTFRLSQLRMSAKLLPLVRMQTKLRPLVFHNPLQLSLMFGTLLLFLVLLRSSSSTFLSLFIGSF